ncbi:MAG: PIN domain-containing protein [Candidatus Portnoybacteria bacterium]|nr:PIN domain-containing protein [Candidatus Portnoybacteria bacterium]
MNIFQKKVALFCAIEEREERVFLPEIVIPEVASGLFRATKDGDFVSRYLRSLRSVPNFSFVAIDSHLADLAVWLITKTGLRGADAMYAALAFYYELILITLDKEQLEKAKKIIEVRLP